jgi:hypothetical protein
MPDEIEVAGDATRTEDGAGAPDESELSQQGEKTDGQGSDGNLDKRLKDTQAKLTETSQAKADLERRLAQLEGKLEVLSTPREQGREPEKQPDPFAFLDSDDFDEKFLEKPRETFKTVINILGNAFAVQEKRNKEQIERVRAEVNRPSQEIAAKVAALKKDPDFADMPDSVLITLAKKGYGGGQGDGKREFPGGSTTQRRAQVSGGGDPENERAIREAFKKMYGEEL